MNYVLKERKTQNLSNGRPEISSYVGTDEFHRQVALQRPEMTKSSQQPGMTSSSLDQWKQRSHQKKESIDPYNGIGNYDSTPILHQSCKSIDSNFRDTPSTNQLITTEKNQRVNHFQIGSINKEILRESAYQKARNQQMEKEMAELNTWKKELKNHIESIHQDDENDEYRRKRHYAQVLGPKKGRLFSPSPP